MLDTFSKRPTFLEGSILPDECGHLAIIKHHERRLEAIAGLCQAAAECGIATDSELDLLLIPEDEVSIWESEGGAWERLYKGIKALRAQLPLIPLEEFGFLPKSPNPFDETNHLLRRIGSGMEVWAFEDPVGSIYKFFLLRIPQGVGATFQYCFDHDVLWATASERGTYSDLLNKILLLNLMDGGMPTEVVGLTPEGVLVVKQTRGQALPDGEDVETLLPHSLIAVPSRFIRCDRSHPRLVIINKQAWLVGDFHKKNIVRDQHNTPRIIDLLTVAK